MRTTKTLRLILPLHYLIFGVLLTPFARVAEAQSVVQSGYTLSTYKSGLTGEPYIIAGMTIDTSTRTIYFAYQNTSSGLWKIAPDAPRPPGLAAHNPAPPDGAQPPPRAGKETRLPRGRRYRLRYHAAETILSRKRSRSRRAGPRSDRKARNPSTCETPR